MGVVKFLLKPNVTKKHGLGFSSGTLRINQTLQIFKCAWVKKVNVLLAQVCSFMRDCKHNKTNFSSASHIWGIVECTPTTGLFIVILRFVFNH